MSRQSRQIANQLIHTELPSSEVAGIIFAAANEVKSIEMPTPVPPSQAIATAKTGGWEVAWTHARSATDPALLARLAKNASANVRRAVAANPNIDAATAQYLLAWAVSKMERLQTRDLLYKKVGLEWILEPENQVYLSHLGGTSLALGVIGARLAEYNDRDLLLRASAIGDNTMQAAVLAVLASNPVPTISLREYHALLVASERELGYTMQNAFARCTVFNAENLEFFAEHAKLPSSHWGNEIPVFTDDGVEFIFQHENRELRLLEYLAKYTADPAVVDRLLDLEDEEVDKVLLERFESLSSAQIDRVVAQAKALELRYSSASFLRLKKPREVEPSPETMLELLCHARSSELWAWLAGKYFYAPRPGDITEIMHAPGTLFNTRMPARSKEFEDKSRAELLDRRQAQLLEIVCSSFDEVVDKPWIDELVDALGSKFFHHSLHGPAWSKYFVDRMVRGIGTSPRAWEVAFGLLDSFEGTLSELVLMARRLIHATADGELLPQLNTTQVA